MSLRASIDIGSNSILLLVAEVNQGKIKKILQEETRITQLGKNIDQGFFDPDSKKESFSTLKEYSEIIKSFSLKLNETRVTATEACRVAKDADSFCDDIKREIGFEIKKLSGKGEAFYTAKGVVQAFQEEALSLLDICGASVVLTAMKG